MMNAEKERLIFVLPLDGSRSRTFQRDSVVHEIVPIEISTNRVEEIWRTMHGCYIGRGGSGAKDGKYSRAISHIQTNSELWMPLLGIWEWAPENFSFHDGRHTFAALRDLGYERITVGVPGVSVAIAKSLLSTVRNV